MGELVNFFPLTVYAHKIGVPDQDRELFAKIIEDDAAAETSKRAATSTWTGDVHGHGFLHERDEFELLFSAIDANMRRYVEELGCDSSILDFYFTRSWGTVQKHKQRVSYHAHMQSHISAVYYPRVPENSGMLMFAMNPNNANEFIPGLIQPEHVKMDVLRPTPLLAQNMNIGVETDLLILFPSKIVHATQTNETDSNRVSIACDIVCTIKDPTGHEFFLPPLDHWAKF